MKHRRKVRRHRRAVRHIGSLKLSFGKFLRKKLHRRVRRSSHRRSMRRNPGLGLGLFGMGLNPHKSARGFGKRTRIVGYRKSGHLRISPFSLSARRMRGAAINPFHGVVSPFHKRRHTTMRHRRRNPFSLGGIIPKSVFGKEMLTNVVGGTVGYFAVKKLPAMLAGMQPTWGLSGNTWQGWATKIAILFAGNYVIGNVFKKPALAKSVMLGGAIAIVTEVLTMNIPQLAGTGYFIPGRQLAGVGASIPANAGTAGRRPIVTAVQQPQPRHV